MAKDRYDNQTLKRIQGDSIGDGIATIPMSC
jgi:hypothetical protein